MKNILSYTGSMKDIHIRKYIPDYIDTYVEPFAGSFSGAFNLMEDGWINKRIILNDKDKEVINFWRCVQVDSDELYKHIVNMNQQLNYNKNTSVKESIKSLIIDKTDKFDLAAYEYLIRTNKLFSRYKRKDIKELKITNLDLYELSVQLMNVDILNMDYKDVLHMYDSDTTLFMIDPPYNVKSVDTYYRCECSKFSHEELRDECRKLKGKWIVRYNDEELTRNLYNDTNIITTTHKKIINIDYVENYYSNL